MAIKVLPPGVAHDPERLARFQREAHLLASLNHPNIEPMIVILGFDRALRSTRASGRGPE